ncbi:hypothetical protein [uncultured Flavobacterium sp.]|uniref:hypothetical protein n=1 Tax=uncultured Flavobacterium sp. TaxID=165435 RepID=UPI00292DC701|nr:hypothetical protein [uncultured Flavobacterium sp.]
MKFYSISFVLFFFMTLASAQHQHNSVSNDAPSTHGMLIFGKEKIYASHLPMFHSPHDYQIILELELDNNTKKLFMADQENNPEYNTYTIEPEKFILPDMIQNPKPFKVNLYRGHFERGGKKIASDIVVSIKQVIYYKKFNPAEGKSGTTNFIFFGNTKEQFMAHQITNRPDFDQILQVKTASDALIKNEKYKLINVNKSDNSPIGVAGNDIQVDVNGTNCSIVLLKQLYLEFDDLK